MDREKIITAAELMDMQFLPRSTVVDGMLPAGCYILAGAPKVGKSFLMAQLCWCVATGIPFLGQPTRRSQVLYLSLEDTGERVQGRLIRMFGVEHQVKRLHLKFGTDLRGGDLLAMLGGSSWITQASASSSSTPSSGYGRAAALSTATRATTRRSAPSRNLPTSTT